MKVILRAALSIVSLTTIVAAQGRGGVPQAPPPRPAIIDYMPQVADLEKAERFYHGMLGLEAAAGDPRGRLTWYPTRPFLQDMYAVDGQIRNFTLRVPLSDLQVEPIQWSEAKGKPLNPRIQDSGAARLVLAVSNMEALAERFKAGGVKVMTAGGKPVAVATPAGGMDRVLVVEDGNGFFVELVQHPVLPARAPEAGPLPYIYAGDVAVTVADVEKAARFYREILGLDVKVDAAFHADPARLEAFGMKGAQYREGNVAWPNNTPQLRLIEFNGVDRKTLTPLVADPNAVLIRMNIKDMESTLAKIKTYPEAQIMNRSGGPFTNGATEWLIVRVPGSSTYLQMIGPVPGRGE